MTKLNEQGTSLSGCLTVSRSVGRGTEGAALLVELVLYNRVVQFDLRLRGLVAFCVYDVDPARMGEQKKPVGGY